MVLQLLEHVLVSCPACWSVWTACCEEWGAEEGCPEESDRWSAVLKQVMALAERQSAELDQSPEIERQYQTLMGLETRRARIDRVRRGTSQISALVSQRLIRASLATAELEPMRSAELAELALEVAWKLERLGHGSVEVWDLLARGWAALGNARRSGGDLALARQTFRMAEVHWSEGSRHPRVAGEMQASLAALLMEEGELALAVEVARRAVDHDERIGESTGQARGLGRLAMMAAMQGDWEQALGLAEQAAGLAARIQEPGLKLLCGHTRARILLSLEQTSEAIVACKQLASLYPAYPEPVPLQGKWLQADVLKALGRHEEARKHYEKVQAGFGSLGASFEAIQGEWAHAHLWGGFPQK